MPRKIKIEYSNTPSKKKTFWAYSFQTLKNLLHLYFRFCTWFKVFKDLIYTVTFATTDMLLMEVSEFNVISKGSFLRLISHGNDGVY